MKGRVNTDSRLKPDNEKDVADSSNPYARRDNLLPDRDWIMPAPRSALFAAGVWSLPFFLLLAFGVNLPQYALALHVIEISSIPISIGLLVFAVLKSSRLRQVREEMVSAESVVDRSTYGLTGREAKAEQMLRTNELQLRQYYELNLNRDHCVFLSGVSCIATGVLILAATMHSVLQLKGDHPSQIAIASLGTVGSVLTIFVAVIYIKMSAATNENLAAFHSRLVETHQLILGSLLTSRIKDDTKRFDALAALSLTIAPAKEQTK